MSNIQLHFYDRDADREATIVVTDWRYDPGKTSTFHEEGWPEEVEVLDGYIVRESPKAIEYPDDLRDTLDLYWDDLHESLYSQARHHYRDGELEFELDRRGIR